MALLSPREIKLSAAAILLLGLIAILITVIVLSGGGEAEREEPRPAERTAPAEGVQDVEYDTFRMLIPEDYKGIFRADWIPYRERHSSWASTQIDPYWIEPRTLVEEELEKETDESVQSFLEELP
jgi:hypothetical protein